MEPIRHPTSKEDIVLKVSKGHFATGHSHINYYIDVTAQKFCLAEARKVALELARDRADLTKKIRAFRQYAEALRQLSGIEQALGLDREAKTHMMQAAALVKQHGFTI
jgi:hypothetical protein